MRVTITEAGTPIFIMVPDGDLFTLGTTHGIMADGIALGITVAGITHGIMDMVDGTVAGADGTVRGITATGIHHGITVMADGMTHGITADITDMEADIVTDFMMDITAAWHVIALEEAPDLTVQVLQTGCLVQVFLAEALQAAHVVLYQEELHLQIQEQLYPEEHHLQILDQLFLEGLQPTHQEPG